MRITLTIDSATHAEAHAFVAAFQRTRNHGLPVQITTDCTVQITGGSYMNVSTPALYPAHAEALFADFRNSEVAR